MRSLTLEGKTIIFKTKVKSKDVFQSFRTAILKHAAKELEKIQKAISYKNSTPEIIH